MKTENNKKIRSTRVSFSSGFTLMEVLIATAVLSIGIVSSIGLISYNISVISNSVNRVVASNLAQDGIEMVRNARDTNWVLGKTADNGANAWDSGISGVGNEEYVIFSCVNGNQNQINPKPSGGDEKQRIDNCAAGGDCEVYVYAFGASKCFSDNFGPSENDSYGNSYDGAAYAGFYRMIRVEPVNDYSNKVIVTVRWNNRGQENYLTAEEILYNWKR